MQKYYALAYYHVLCKLNVGCHFAMHSYFDECQKYKFDFLKNCISSDKRISLKMQMFFDECQKMKLIFYIRFLLCQLEMKQQLIHVTVLKVLPVPFECRTE